MWYAIGAVCWTIISTIVITIFWEKLREMRDPGDPGDLPYLVLVVAGAVVGLIVWPIAFVVLLSVGAGLLIKHKFLRGTGNR